MPDAKIKHGFACISCISRVDIRSPLRYDPPTMRDKPQPLTLTQIQNHVSAWRLAATLKPEVKRIDRSTFYVRGRTGEYLVKLSSEGGQCGCMAGQHERVCYHLVAAITHAVGHATKEQV